MDSQVLYLIISGICTIFALEIKLLTYQQNMSSVLHLERAIDGNIRQSSELFALQEVQRVHIHQSFLFCLHMTNISSPLRTYFQSFKNDQIIVFSLHKPAEIGRIKGRNASQCK